MRTDVCVSDDHDTIDRLLAAIREVGGRFEGEVWGIGVGLHRFQFPDGEISVFVDAWLVDVAGPDDLVQRVLTTMGGAG